MTRTFLIALALAAVVAAPLQAQDAAPARFFIERIEVRNAHRVSADLIVSESLLRAGAEYTEDELRAASLRLNRLPYLLSADFALEKGSDRGRHVLVITVAETKPFFYFIDARPILNDEQRRTAVDYAGSLGADTSDAAIGYRKFIGRRGVAHIGITSRRDRQEFTTDYSAPAIGYTQYDLFGTRAFATVNLRWPVEPARNPTLSPQVVVGIPLTPKHTLTLDYEETRFSRSTTFINDAPYTLQDGERIVSFAWAYNTTNQPFVPTRGTFVRIAPQWSSRDLASYSRFIMIPGTDRVDAYADHFNSYGVDAIAARYFELSDRDSVSATLQAGWTNTEERANQLLTPQVIRAQPLYALIGGGWSYNLRPDAAKEAGDSRVELDAQYVARQGDYDREGQRFVDLNSDEGMRLSAAWVRRNVWGTLRLGLGYTWK
ncbi:MAG: BamA/TamA family outer membrane protein [Acidobacteria bacterium]|nr:BamA/TamA family outer membrane protein [Acidobacteriota bacterium]MBV9478102.1 BamA/TamA family outer membrane protein [Acidobacteriota bacterium]